MKRVCGSLLVLFLSPFFADAQLFGPLPVIDIASYGRLVAEGIQLAQQIGIMNGTLSVVTQQQLWLAQVILSKIPWATQLPPGAQTSTVINTIGETIALTPALATGVGSNLAWTNAATTLSPLAPILLGAQLGVNPVPQLATVEAINAAGTNNIAIIGEARSFLSSNVGAMQGLQTQILSNDPAQNGPTQQMQYAALAATQNQSTFVQILQTTTGILETDTAIAKGISDANTYDLNMAIANALGYTGPTGFGATFSNAGTACSTCP